MPEKEHSNEMVFPFQTSDIIRFFQYNRVIGSFYGLEGNHDHTDEIWFRNHHIVKLNKKEKMVYATIIKHPQATTQTIGEMIDLSRHTISRLRKKFYRQKLINDITIPNLRALGFEILAFYHFQFNPGKYPCIDDIAEIDTPSTIFLARKRFETVLISAYPSYQDYKKDKINKIRFLKENDFISYTPFVRKYMFDQMESIKEFDFAPITKKILEI